MTKTVLYDFPAWHRLLETRPSLGFDSMPVTKLVCLTLGGQCSV